MLLLTLFFSLCAASDQTPSSCQDLLKYLPIITTIQVISFDRAIQTSWRGFESDLYEFANVTYDHQGGPAGCKKFFCTHQFLWYLYRPLGVGMLTLHTTFSLEPGTVGQKGYPLLFAHAGTCDCVKLLINRYPPHEFVTELGISYTHPILQQSLAWGYFAVAGMPALGPLPEQRITTFFMPEGPITRPWFDSTQTVFGLLTVGGASRWLQLEASVFTGREPDENHWNIDKMRFNSFSGRAALFFTPQWSAQLSAAYIKSPDVLEPQVNIQRVTASITYDDCGDNYSMQVTGAWARNIKRPGNDLDGLFIESTLELHDRHVLFGRFEHIELDDFFSREEYYDLEYFKVSKLEGGYMYQWPVFKHFQWSFGASLELNIVPKVVENYYAKHPFSYFLFTRFELLR